MGVSLALQGQPTSIKLGFGNQLEGENVIPGFSIAVAELFYSYKR